MQLSENRAAVYIGIVVSVLVSIVLMTQNWNIQRENDRINHRLDVRDAYFNKGLIDGAKEREKALDEQRAWNERILAHCKQQKDGCGLPNDLAIMPTQRTFDSLEAILTRNKE